jgi:hypothetical protein
LCWSFEAPPAASSKKFDFSLRGVCENWRDAESPDINFFNLGKKILNASLTHKFLARGLLLDPTTQVLFVPKEMTNDRFTYHQPHGGKSWMLLTGTRKIKRPDHVESFRYHFSPSSRALLDYFGADVVQFRAGLHLTDEMGHSLDPKLIQRRRKAICKSWWNHQWLARLFATLELLAEDEGRITIGISEQVELSRWPRMLFTDTSLDEELLKPAALAAEEFIETMKDDGEGTVDETVKVAAS